MADDAAQKVLRDALKLLPNSIHSGALDPRASATTRLRWIELGLRDFCHRPPIVWINGQTCCRYRFSGP